MKFFFRFSLSWLRKNSDVTAGMIDQWIWWHLWSRFSFDRYSHSVSPFATSRHSLLSLFSILFRYPSFNDWLIDVRESTWNDFTGESNTNTSFSTSRIWYDGSIISSIILSYRHSLFPNNSKTGSKIGGNSRSCYGKDPDSHKDISFSHCSFACSRPFPVWAFWSIYIWSILISQVNVFHICKMFGHAMEFYAWNYFSKLHRKIMIWQTLTLESINMIPIIFKKNLLEMKPRSIQRMIHRSFHSRPMWLSLLSKEQMGIISNQWQIISSIWIGGKIFWLKID